MKDRTRLRVRRFSAALLGSIALACGSGAAGGAKPAGEGGSCLDAAGGSFCKALVDHFSRCSPSGAPREQLLEDCRATWGEFPTRANGCFVERLGKCLASSCDSVESCFREATVASDPESFDAEASLACTSQGSCGGLPESWMAQCVRRFEECSADEDVCVSAVALQRPYRGEVEGCLTRPECGDLEDCVYLAMGQH